MDSLPLPSAREKLAKAAHEADAVGERTAPLLRSFVWLVDAITSLSQRLDTALSRYEAQTDARTTAATQQMMMELTKHLPSAAAEVAAASRWWVVVAHTVLFLALIVGAYWVGESRGYKDGTALSVHLEQRIGQELSRPDAELWATLMRYNDIAKTPYSCSEEGRQVCHFDFWGGPGPAPAAQTAAVDPAPAPPHTTKGGARPTPH